MPTYLLQDIEHLTGKVLVELVLHEIQAEFWFCTPGLKKPKGESYDFSLISAFLGIEPPNGEIEVADVEEYIMRESQLKDLITMVLKNEVLDTMIDVVGHSDNISPGAKKRLFEAKRGSEIDTLPFSIKTALADIFPGDEKTAQRIYESMRRVLLRLKRVALETPENDFASFDPQI